MERGREKRGKKEERGAACSLSLIKDPALLCRLGFVLTASQLPCVERVECVINVCVCV